MDVRTMPVCCVQHKFLV